MVSDMKTLCFFILLLHLKSLQTNESYFDLPKTLPIHEKYDAFLRELEQHSQIYQNKLLEMGLNSDNILIFNKSVTSLFEKRHFPALEIFQKILQREDLNAQKKELLFTNYQKLKFYSLPEKSEQILLLKNLLHEQSPTQNKALYLWLLEMWGEIADNSEKEAVLSVQRRYPELREMTDISLEKMSLNTIYPDMEQKTDKFIAATRSNNMAIRTWGLENLSQTNTNAVAEYLHLLYEQANFTTSKLEFLLIQEKTMAHQKKFPKLYEQEKSNNEELSDTDGEGQSNDKEQSNGEESDGEKLPDNDKLPNSYKLPDNAK